MNTLINENTAQEIINKNSGKFFTVEFIKKDGTRRVMNCRTGVIKYLKGTGKGNQAPYIVTVYDIGIKQYRSFDLRRVVLIKAGGQSYKIVHSTNV